MTEPTFDKDGYPTEETLKAIREWPTGNEDHQRLLNFCLFAWDEHVGSWDSTDAGVAYSLSTGGWSGNESIIEAMQSNIAFWHRYWKSTTRGGHYVFEPVY